MVGPLYNPIDYPVTSKNLKFLQVNLRHSKLASASLPVVILENDVDVIILEEPYAKFTCSPALADVPPGCVVFHALNYEHAYGAAIMVKLSLASADAQSTPRLATI